jgi:hypothetical protein
VFIIRIGKIEIEVRCPAPLMISTGFTALLWAIAYRIFTQGG